MTSPTLWQRTVRARVVQVLVVYLGASWVVLEVAGTLADALSLPPWVSPLTLILLLVGLVVILATAWVQSLPSTTAAEEAGEVPGDWQLAPREVLTSLRAGRVPHLTWGRAVAGGVAALGLLFGGAGLHAVFTGGGPSPGDLPEAATAIAILPFNVSGAEHELYREGMVDLLSANLDGVGGLRTIDSRTVLARWDEGVGGVARPDLDVALGAAARTGARYAVLGSMVPAGSRFRLDVEIHDLAAGTELGSARVEGAQVEMLGLVDRLSVAIAGALLGASGETASERRLETITTSSLAALEAYLEGERAYRGGDFEMAGEAFERAVAIDSTFALGWARLGSAKGWGLGERFQRSREARARAHALIERLGPREASLIRARTAWDRREPHGIPILEDFVRRYPDESEAWYDLGDLYLHQADIAAVTPERIAGAFERAIKLDPSFAGYYIHAIDFAFVAADSAAVRRLVDAYWRAGGEENQFSTHWGPGYDLLFGDEAARAAALDSALSMPAPTLTFGTLTSHTRRPARELPLLRAAMARPEQDPASVLDRYSRALRRAGRWSEARPVLEAWPATGTALVSRVRWQLLHGLGDPDRLHDDLAAFECGETSFCWREVALHAAHAGHTEEASTALDRLEALLREAVAEQGGDSRREKVVDFHLAQARAWAALSTGDPERAVALWRAREGRAEVDFLNYALALEETGNLEAAARYYATQTWRSEGGFAVYRLARLYERLDRVDEALERYLEALTMWEEADPDFAPLRDAQEAVARLAALEGA